jgi:MFS family permease
MKLLSVFKDKSEILQGNFLILTLSWIVMYFAYPIPATYASLYYLSLGADEFILSVIGFSGSIAIAIVQFPGGYLADKHGRRWLVSVMTYGLAIGAFFFIIAPSWHFIVIGLVIQNLCAIYAPALMAMVIDSLPPKKRATGYSFQSVVTNLVFLPGPIIAQYLIFTFNFDLGMRIGYSIVMIAYFIAATLRLRLRETLPSNGNNRKPKLLDALKEYPKSVKESLKVWSQVSKSAFYLFIATVIINGLVVSCQTYFVVYATSILLITESQWAIIVAVMYLSIVIPVILAGLKMDTVGRKSFIILGYLLFFPSMFLFVIADFYLLLFAYFLYGMGNMLQLTGYQVLIGDFIPRNLRGTALGCVQFFMYLSQGLFLIISGFLYAFVLPQLPFLILGVVSIPLAFMVLLKIREPSLREV